MANAGINSGVRRLAIARSLTDEPDPGLLADAAKLLREGGVVAFPTETVYGLCVDATDREAVERLRALKGRKPEHAFAYLLADREAARDLTGRDLPPLAARIADRLWPGPVTLVVPTGERGRIGLRLPEALLPRALARETGRPLIQTSCNRTGEPPALDGAGVVANLGEDVDLLLDAGRTPGAESSTVVVCDEVSFSVARKGAMPTSQIIRAATDLVLVVCTGNLCRSPLAEALLRNEVAGRLRCEPAATVRHGWRFDSFGMSAPSDEPATEHTLTVASEMGLDLSTHLSRPFRILRVREAARIYGLTGQHVEFLRPYFQTRPEALDLLDPEGREIPDPYSRSLKVYRRSAELIRAACEKRAAELVPSGEGGE